MITYYLITHEINIIYSIQMHIHDKKTCKDNLGLWITNEVKSFDTDTEVHSLQ